jgi:hypothetical protein
MVGIGGHTFEAVEQDLLQRLNVLVLSTNADIGATVAVLSLLALITEHLNTPVVVRTDVSGEQPAAFRLKESEAPTKEDIIILF